MSTAGLEHPSLRLAPITRRPSLLVWLMGLGMRLYLGKVMTPLPVIYARMPRLALPQLFMLRLAERGLHLPPLLVHLVQVRVSMHNNCTFCMDLHRALALRARADREKLGAVLEPQLSAGFTSAERAALQYVDEVACNGRCSEPTFETLRVSWSERDIVELTWLCAFTTYLNRLAVPLGIGSDGFCELHSELAGS
jgi:AhpD family alkylhydroperoxidase